METVNHLLASMSGGFVGAALSFVNKPTATARFENVSESSTTSVVILIIIIILYMLLSVLAMIAIYKLTDSTLQTILYFFFGCIYLTFAIIYYGFSGHKFVKKS